MVLVIYISKIQLEDYTYVQNLQTITGFNLLTTSKLLVETSGFCLQRKLNLSPKSHWNSFKVGSLDFLRVLGKSYLQLLNYSDRERERDWQGGPQRMILSLLGITMIASPTSGLCCCQSFSKSNENWSGIFLLYGSFLQHMTEERRLHTLLDP